MVQGLDNESATKLPSTENIRLASPLKVFDSKGSEVTFGSLFADTRTVIVFIRHFLCGMCHNYVMQLGEIPREVLQEANTSLVIIGCGDWQMLETYKKNTGFEGRIYADPTRTLYHHFGMIENIAAGGKDEPKASYIGGSFSTIATSIMRALRDPIHWGKQGNISQNGGEFIFGPGDTCSLAHRMRNSTDHLDVEKLVKQVRGNSG